jgi:hypothetical protein
MHGDRFGKAFEADLFERVISRNMGHSFLESIIECECHEEILMVPDLKAMDKAIDQHVREHRRMEKYSSKTDAERIENDLIAQVLKKASEQKSDSQQVCTHKPTV